MSLMSSNPPAPQPSAKYAATTGMAVKASYSDMSFLKIIAKIKDYPEYDIVSTIHPPSLHRMFTFAANAMENNMWELLELDDLQSQVNTTLHCLKVIKRYRKLQLECVDLAYSEEGFTLSGHTFKTLDDVEKAIKNKAFL